MSNFSPYLSIPSFAAFAPIAESAEKILSIDPAACVLNCRRAMEAAVKWMYAVDGSLVAPWDDKLVTLINTEEFRGIVDEQLIFRLDFIRRMGNNAAHGGKVITREQAVLCLQNLFVFFDFLAYCYGENYTEHTFNPALLAEQSAQPTPPAVDEDAARKLDALIKENAALKEQLTQRREEQHQTYVPKPLEISEYKTRKLYIDAMLQDAGWVEGKNWLNEVKLPGMPNKSETGYADYVLYGDDGKALAIVEAKRSCVDPAVGRQQAKLYADIIEKQQGRRPVIFLTNGFETKIDDGQYPERKCAAIWSKRDLEKWFNLLRMRTHLDNIVVDENIAGRYYQENAIKAVCNTFDARNRRKALLVMATGSGKTRTVIALCKVLLEHGWVKNILFLADRNSLVTQAKRSFVNLLPELSVTNLCEERDNTTAHCVFSTYQTMMNCIDAIEDAEGKLFTVGHFDLVICDEAHRSIYNKYRDIFTYFDAPLVGLTATPKDEIDKNTYALFDLGNGAPTYGYELAQAVKDGYLCDFVSVETTLKFIQQGIVYDELTDEEKEEYEAKFADENGDVPECVMPSALNEWVFNEDTIRKVLNTLMTDGLKIDYGSKIGKSIIFAKNHTHAEKILEIFNREYPHLYGYAKVIDNYMTYAQSAIDEFSDPQKLPQIAISVDMLDTGIDVPDVLNLVFFKKVMSKAKFWQMIGRGTRLCPGLIDGKDKDKFYIFDFCGNFEFFRMSKGNATASALSLQGALFSLKAQMAFKLQDAVYKTDELSAFRQTLVDDMVRKVSELNQDNFAVKQHLKFVELYTKPNRYQSLSYEDTLMMQQELAPLLLPEPDDPKALRFDALLYGMELAHLAGLPYNRAHHDLLKKADALSKIANVPEIAAQSALLEKILHTDYVENTGVDELEKIRKALRDLMKYITNEQSAYETGFVRAEFYVRQHQNELAIAKLKMNVPLTDSDITQLEEILWSEVGTKQDYEAEYGKKPLGEFIREIVGLDMNAAKEAFSAYLTNVNLDSRQIYFVNQIVEYIVHNGMMKDMSILQEAPFIDQGSIIEVFTDLSVWKGIKGVIDTINANACGA